MLGPIGASRQDDVIRANPTFVCRAATSTDEQSDPWHCKVIRKAFRGCKTTPGFERTQHGWNHLLVAIPNGTLLMQHRTFLISYFRPLLVPRLLKVATKSFTRRTGPWGGLPQHIIASRASHASSAEESIEEEGARQEIEREGMERANRGCTKGEELYHPYPKTVRTQGNRGLEGTQCSCRGGNRICCETSLGRTDTCKAPDGHWPVRSRNGVMRSRNMLFTGR